MPIITAHFFVMIISQMGDILTVNASVPRD
jgi:hypothetical protein